MSLRADLWPSLTRIPRSRAEGRDGRSLGWLRLAFCVSCVAVCHEPAAAQGPITASDFAIDLVTTPALGSSRIIGLAGASTALAEGVDAVPFNPAAYAARTSWERDWWEWEVGLSVQFPGAFATTDFFGSGRDSLGVDEFSALEMSGRLQLGDLGFGTSVVIQNYSLRADSATRIDLNTTRIGAGYALLDGQLVIGGGVRVVSFDLSEAMAGDLVQFTDTSGELGVIVRPATRRWRVGAALRTPLSAGTLGDRSGRVGDFWLPTSFESPWEFSVGFAWQWLARPFNPRFLREKNVQRGLLAELRERWCVRQRRQRAEETGRPWGEIPCTGAERPRNRGWWRAERSRRTEERQRMVEEAERRQAALHALWEAHYESRPRQFILLTADLILLGRTPNAIGLDAFARQERIRRGADLSVGLRVGAESEVWPHRLKLRLGTYLEPARYEGTRARIHGTGGFDLRLLRLFGTDWRITVFVDVADNYVNWGLGFGSWH